MKINISQVPLFILDKILIAIIIVATSCGKPSPQPTVPAANSQQDEATSLLTSGEWKLTSVTVDGVDKTALYAGFTIRFTSGNFTTVNGAPLWPSAGTWKFQGDDVSTIVRDDGIVVQIQVTDTGLIMKFAWLTTTFGPGRSTSLKGQQVFTMKK